MNQAEPAQQFAALPVRSGRGGFRVLLVTSRETGRWLIPKGWPIAGLSPSQTAAREAMEEAGVSGRIGIEPFGHYYYAKRSRGGATRYVRVDTHLLHVLRQYDQWPELGERLRRWFDVEDAAQLVREPDLADMIRRLRQFTPRQLR